MDLCIVCGSYVPEGNMICWQCQQKIKGSKLVSAQQELIVSKQCSAAELFRSTVC